jgi:hypothetical protein
MLRLAAGDYALTLAPERGGAVLDFDWRGEPLMRPICGPDVLDAPYRPLVPFSLGIVEERPSSRCRTWLGSNPLHGLDWLSEWSIAARTPASATLLDSRAGGPEAPAYAVSQAFALSEQGLTITVALVNLGGADMPVSLGAQALVPLGVRAALPCTRPLALRWAERDLTLVLEPSDNLAVTGLTAPGQDIRCCAQPAMLQPGGIASASLHLRAAVHA